MSHFYTILALEIYVQKLCLIYKPYHLRMLILSDYPYVSSTLFYAVTTRFLFYILKYMIKLLQHILNTHKSKQHCALKSISNYVHFETSSRKVFFFNCKPCLLYFTLMKKRVHFLKGCIYPNFTF